MRIIIIGAGLGGLTAAYVFARNGKHTVTVLERNKDLSPQGSGLNTRPSASRLLHQWDLEADMVAISDSTPTVLLRDLKDGKLAMRSVLLNASAWPDHGTHREHLIKMLYQRAVAAGANVRFEVGVSGVKEESGQATVEMTDGTTMIADMVLAADGIRSKTRTYVLRDLIEAGHDVAPRISDITLYGVKLSGEEILGNDIMREKLTDNNCINVYMGNHAFMVGRWNAKLQIGGGLFAIQGDSNSDQKGLWDEAGDIDWLRSWYERHGICAELVEVLKTANKCDRWRLAEMPDLPRWRSPGSRVLLLGDSAHGMFPNAAQGYSMIVEDIGVLEYLVDRAGEQATSTVPDIAKIWEEIRKPRVEKIKEYAKWNTMMFAGNVQAPKLKGGAKSEEKDLTNVKPNMNANFHSSAFVKWTLDHDAIGAAQDYIDGLKAKL